MEESMEQFDILNERGEFTGKVASRDACHTFGYWHRAVYAFIINSEGQILLQKRSQNKKLWPNKWDMTVGGHVQAGELGRQAIIRECKEELGIDICDNDVKYLVGSSSVYNNKGYINNHYDECYLIMKDINIKHLKLQLEEVSEIKYFSKQEILDRINNNYEGLTEKTGSWNIFKFVLESNYIKKLGNKWTI